MVNAIAMSIFVNLCIQQIQHIINERHSMKLYKKFQLVLESTAFFIRGKFQLNNGQDLLTPLLDESVFHVRKR